jgi:chaperonin GroES
VNIRMVNNRVLVRPDDPETKIGNVYLPDSAQAKSRRGTVLAVGPGKLDDKGERHQCEVKPGDVVLLREFSGQDVVVGDQKLYVVFDHEILAVVD